MRRAGITGSGGSTTSTANRNTSPDPIRREMLIKKRAKETKKTAILLTVLFTCTLAYWALPFTVFGLKLGNKVNMCVRVEFPISP